MTSIKPDMRDIPALQDSHIESLLSDYLTDKPPRVWSLLVTLFGDLAQETDTQLSNAFLITIFDRIGIKPDALRVALFRLRKENWIATTRIGRNSLHALTQWGRAECLRANPRIYGNPLPQKNAYLILANPANRLDRDMDSSFHIGAHTYIANMPIIDKSEQNTQNILEIALLEGRPIPSWISDRLCPPELVSASIAFQARLARLKTMLHASADYSPLQIALLRGLIVHDWRRIVLKLPALPAFLFPADLQIEACQTLVHKLLKQLARPSPQHLDESLKQRSEC